LVNRLTKIVHFKPLEMEAAREILGKLVAELNERLMDMAMPQQEEDSGGGTPPQRSGARRASHDEDARPAARRISHVRVELDESAEELILREGFSEEFGARNLERVMDRLLGMLIAEALLCGEIATGQKIRILANEDRIQLCSGESLSSPPKALDSGV
jgi:ATP-dependent Clp protease ATP-binding subunit ClpA